MIEAPGNPANHQATCKYFLSVPELLVIAVHLVDHLGRAADQRRTALDKVLERWKYLLLTEASLQGPGTLRTLGGSERLRPASFVRRNSRGCLPRPSPAPDRGRSGPACAVVAHQLRVRFDRIGHIR